MAGLICAFIDAEQVTVQDVNNYEDVSWPPRPVIQLVHWWGHQCDPALLQRSAIYQFFIWIDIFYFLPFYAAGIYAVVFAKRWLRDHLMLQSASIITTTSGILYANLCGPTPSPNPLMMLSGYFPYVLVPFGCLLYCLTHQDIFQGRPGGPQQAKSDSKKQ